jgi:hypothetical protein
MTEEEMRKLAEDLRRFAELYVGNSTYSLQFETTAFFIGVKADEMKRNARV